MLQTLTHQGQKKGFKAVPQHALTLRRPLKAVLKGEASPVHSGSSFETPLRGFSG